MVTPIFFLPYYHPTTVCLVDDNQAFIESVLYEAPSDWNILWFTSPEQALEEINRPDPREPLVERCFSVDYADQSKPIVHLHLSILEQEMQWHARYKTISAVLVDYAMPTMDGLEVCSQVADRNIRRGLLTGAASAKTGVAAFNKGLIDRYIPKQAIESTADLIPHVQYMQKDYFDKMTGRITDALQLHPPPFMAERELVPVFEQILRKYDVVEYYLANDPAGYLMLRADGTLLRLVIINGAELQAQREVAWRYDAPAKVQRKLRRGRYICFMNEKPADYMGHEPYPWDEVLLKAKRVRLREEWYLAVAENPPADIDFDPAASCYDHFLANRDNPATFAAR